MNRVSIFLICLMLSFSVKAGGIPVFDGVRHATDIIDNIQDILDQVNQIKNQVEQIKKLTRQVEQMDDYLKRVGKAAGVNIDLKELIPDDIIAIKEEIDEYIKGAGAIEKEIREGIELYGDIDKIFHKKLAEPAPEKKYEKHERVEKEFYAYKKASESISQKRLDILNTLDSLSSRLNSAETDQEVQKLNSSINAHKLMLDAITAEEEKQYRSFMAELERNANAYEKERTRFEERLKFLDSQNRSRPAYTLTKSDSILELIEGE